MALRREPGLPAVVLPAVPELEPSVAVAPLVVCVSSYFILLFSANYPICRSAPLRFFDTEPRSCCVGSSVAEGTPTAGDCQFSSAKGGR